MKPNDRFTYDRNKLLKVVNDFCDELHHSDVQPQDHRNPDSNRMRLKQHSYD